MTHDGFHDRPHRQADPGDMRAAAEEARRRAECEWCDEDDWENLLPVPKVYDHDCSRHQHADPEPIILCGDCRADHDPEQDYVDRLTAKDTVMVRFDCGFAVPAEEPEEQTIVEETTVGWDDDGNPIIEERDISLPGKPEVPMIPVECACGATIDEVYY